MFQWMRAGSWGALAAIGLILGGCSNSNGESLTSASPASASVAGSSPSAVPRPQASPSGAKAEEIEMAFAPVPSYALQTIELGPSAKIVADKAVTVDGRDIRLELRQKPDTPTEIYASLRDEDRHYEIGLVGSYGLEGVQEPRTMDVTGDGQEELLLTGAMGASYEETKVIRYDSAEAAWKNVLTMGSPAVVDLDDDGKDDLAAVSMGSVPSYVFLFRWNRDGFEMADASSALGKSDARLVKVDGRTRIQSGSDAQNLSTYRYANGRLIEADEG